MAAPVFSPPVLLAALRALPPAPRYVIACSGGPDSHALLDAAARLRDALAPATVCAVHVDHGLAPESPAWVSHCASVCAGLDLPLEVLRVDARPRAGASPEAAARRARYAAIAAFLNAGEVALTAHTREDQAETVLLGLLRGGGARGLAGMPRARPLGAGWLGRPLLDLPRAALAAYAAARGLESIHDPSNEDPRLGRGHLRRHVLPALRERWPGVDRTLARVAAGQADLAALADEVGAADLAATRGKSPDQLRVPALAALDGFRARNTLRLWIESLGLPAPASAHLDRIVEDALAAPRDRAPLVRWPGAEVRRHRDALHAMPPLPPALPGQVLDWPLERPLALPLGRLRALPATGEGIDAARLAGARVEVRFRRGGERCRPAGRGVTRPLKALLQEQGIPPWLRPHLPLVCIGGEIAAVPGVCICEPFAAAPGGAGRVLRWEGPLGSDPLNLLMLREKFRERQR